MVTRPTPTRLAGALALGLLGLASWWAATSPTPPPAAAPLAAADRALAPLTATAPWPGGRVPPHSAHQADPLLQPGLRQRLEDLWLLALADGTPEHPETLKARLLALVPAHVEPGLVPLMQALLARYVDYRVALKDLPNARPDDPGALRRSLTARQALRARYFTAEEHEALFAQEQRLDDHTLTQLEIARHPSWTSDEKQRALTDAAQLLDPEQRQWREQATAHLAVAQQTQAFNAQGTSAHERYAQRAAQHGDAAAQRLAALDAQEQDWQARLSDYAQLQAQQADEATLAQARQRLFSDTETLRLDAALALRANRTTRP